MSMALVTYVPIKTAVEFFLSEVERSYKKGSIKEKKPHIFTAFGKMSPTSVSLAIHSIKIPEDHSMFLMVSNVWGLCYNSESPNIWWENSPEAVARIPVRGVTFPFEGRIAF